MEYETIIMMNFKPSVTRYYSELHRALKQGGTLLIESLMTKEMTEPLGAEDAYKDYYFKSNEVLNNLKGLRILFYHEYHLRGKQRVQCLAQKPLDKDAVKYSLFDMHTGQGDEGKSNHLKLAEQLFKKKD
jgi:hypothetical protein